MADEKVLNEEEMVEYDTFTYDLNGKVMEWAITDNFEFEGKKYIVCAEVVGEALSEEGLYLFESVSEEGDEITVKNIDSEEEYDRVVDAYCALEEE
ncbi:MAG: DUF1292 domain-containing protein [Agathobacter sp.]|nr:DUF1292 domain-containing protein [Agathobacter sp.]